MKMLFATIVLDLPREMGGPIQPDSRIPDGLLNEKQIARLLAKGYAREIDTAPAPVAAPAAPAGPIVRPTKGRWDFDLETIKNDTLDVLNMKANEHAIAGNQQAIEPFEDIEEALAFMTMDA